MRAPFACQKDSDCIELCIFWQLPPIAANKNKKKKKNTNKNMNKRKNKKTNKNHTRAARFSLSFQIIS